MPEYWYNVQTHQVEEDAMSDWSQLIGPYKTREEAEHALEKVKARNETWEKDSWTYSGNTGVWAQMTIDEESNTVYMPVELPTGDYYGGHRPGAGDPA